ncbi:Delta-like protein D [Aphelenchoides besseyi]|nr:Delta-like protein D [Aphelenchoides besseyi]
MTSAMPPLDDFAVQTLNEIISAGVSSRLIYEASVCASYPCWNEGSCVESNQSLSGYTCFCNQLFSGQHCNIKTADNCTNVFCGPGTFCSPSTSTCLSYNQYDSFPSCNFDATPCYNGGNCILVDNDRPQCVCPPLYQGLLCENSIVGRVEIPMNWNALQFLFLFAIVFLLASALLTFCYGSHFGCYLNLGPRKQRYSKWNGNGDLDLSWDNMSEDEDEDLIGGQHLYRRASTQRASATDTSKNCFEMKSKPLLISSSTAETFVTYHDSPTSAATPLSNVGANPVDVASRTVVNGSTHQINHL